MRTVTFKCDLCREEYKDLTKLRTIYWVSSPLPKRFIMKEVLKEETVDKQICVNCIEMIKHSEV